jgi:uncharacterized membrane protein
MINKFLFAGVLGVLYSFIVMAFVDFPEAAYMSIPGALVLGWFSNDIQQFIFGRHDV